MRHYKTVVVPAKPETTEQELEKTTCDLCGTIIIRERFSEEMVSVKYKTGESYPEGGCGTITEVDICPSCFNEKLKPWLESQGCTFHTTKWEW